MPTQKQPHPNPLTYRPQELASRIGVSRRYIDRLSRHPDPNRRLPTPIKIGRATFWRADEIADWLVRQNRRA